MASSSGREREQGQPVELDLRGERCPMTFVRTRLALEDLPLGESLRVRVDFEPATRNIPKSAIEWGQLVGEIRDLADGSWTILLTRRVK